MKHFQHLLFGALLLLFTTKVSAYDFSSNGVYYNIISSVDNTVEVTYQSKTRVPYGYGYTDSWVSGMTGSKTIPSQVTYNGIIYTVTAIGEHAFYQSTATKVSLPNTIKSIGYYAFYGSSINEMTIPSSVTSLGTYAFGNCNNITSITIPSTVTDGGTYTFSYCANLSSAIVYCESIPYDCFSYCTKLSSVTIGSGVKTINSDAFERCYSLESLTIPDAVTTMSEYAISECTSLKELNIGKGLQSFSNTGNVSQCPLEKITVSSLNQYLSCPANSNVIIDRSTNTLILGCKNSVIPSTVKKIGNYAFRGCKITSVIIPYYVTEIGNNSFDNCNALESVTFESNYNLISVGNCAFYGCKALEEIQLPSYLTTLGDDVFSNCTNLKSVSFGSSPKLTKIGAYAFNYCSSLPLISIPASVTTIGNYAFSGCSGLKHVIVNSSSTSSIPSITEGVFSATTYSTAKLHCLYQSVLSTLQYSSPWSKFCVIDKYWEPSSYSSSYMDISETNAIIYAGNTKSLNATPMYSRLYATSLNEIAWSSSNEAVATVDANGIVTGVAPGNAVITASKMYGYPLSNTCEVTIKYEYSMYMQEKNRLSSAGSVIPVYMDNTKEICNLQFDVELPEGIDIAYEMNEDEEEGYVITKGERCKEAHTVVVSKNSANTYRVIISSTSNAVLKNTDKSLPIAYIKLVASKSLDLGYYTMKLKNVKLTNYNNGLTEVINAEDTESTIDFADFYAFVASSGDISQGNVSITGSQYNPETKDVRNGSSVILTATSNTGYHFVKWVEDGKELSTERILIIENVSSNHNITAVFAPNSYNVKFVADGKTVSESTQNYGAEIITPTAPEKEGYTFKSWGEVEETVPAHDVTYTAVYEINKYRVRFIADGEDVYNMEQEYGSAITVPTAPKKDGHAFITWGEVAETVPANDVEYTAEYVMVGDLVTDGKLNIGDLTKLVGVILRNEGETLDERNFKKADVLVDNTIDIGDYTRLVGKILDADVVKAKGAYTTYCNPSISVEKNGKDAVSLSLKDADNVTAMQFDMNVAEGTTVALKGMPQHTVVTNMLDDNTMRVLVYSANNAAIADNSSVSISIENAVGELAIKNIVCATPEQKAKLADMNISLDGNATVVSGVKNVRYGVVSVKGGLLISSDKDQQIMIHTIGGQLVETSELRAGETKRVSLRSGNYIINGQKFNVK